MVQTIPDVAASGVDENKSVNRTWTITNNGLVFSECDVTFNWNATDADAGTDANNFILAKYDTPNWTLPTVSSRTATSLTVLDLTSFSDFAIGEVIPVVNIPDANFKAALVGNPAINTNTDSEIQVSEATAYTGGIDVHALGIGDLTGIEAFTGFTSSTCYNNSLTTLNVSANTNLTYLSCFQNQLTTLDVSKQYYISTVYCSVYNQIPTIDLSANTALTFLVFDNGQVTSMDVSANTALTYINGYNNPLTSLNIKNGNNANLTYFNATQCPALTCIQVDNVATITGNVNAFKDAAASYSENCGCIVNIPDANFKAALLANPLINTNGNGLIECAEAAAYTGVINVINLNIADLTGIEAFTQITALDCNTNHITSLDVSNNTLLQSLNCADNSISSLDVSANTALTLLWCYINPISSLDVSANTLLTNLAISNTSITSIDLSNNLALTRLVLENNSFTTLDISANTALQNLYITNNLFTSINVSANTSLQGLFCGSNQLTALDLSTHTALINLACQQNQLTSLNIRNGNNSNLVQFNATSNPSLTCIQVDTVAYMNTYWSAGKDAGASYSIDCSVITPVPAAALHFDGVDDVVVGPDELIPTSGDYTVSVWAKQDQFVPGQLKNIISQSRQFYIGQYYDNTLRIGDSWYSVTAWPTDLGWHNYTVVRTSSNTYFYLDGALTATRGAAIPIPGPPPTPATFYLGAQWSGNSEFFKGSIDEVRVWSRALDSAEIVKTLNCEITAARQGLVAVYNFNQGTTEIANPADTLLTDASGNGKNANLQNFTLTGSTSNWVAPGGVVTGTECCNINLSTSVGDTLIVCNESSQMNPTGNVNLIVTGGTAPFTFSGSDTTNLGAGFYNYMVTDATGCTANATMTSIVTNCIVPYYLPPVNDTVNTLIGTELTQLYNAPDSLVDQTTNNNIFLINYDLDQVLIEVIADSASYDYLYALLQTPEYGLNNIIDNGDSTLVITGFMPRLNLLKLNMLIDQIKYVRPYYPPIASGATGLTTTQGDKAIVADKARKAWKLSGKGVKVGVLSDSYNTKFGDPAALDIINGDLPGPGNLINMKQVQLSEEYPYGRGTDEGRAMLQIVHDVAPDACLYFRSGFISAGNFADGIRALRDSGCTVIVDDITYLTEPYFSDGIIAKAVEDVTSTGVSYFTSAGNFGTKSFESTFIPAAVTPSGYLGVAHDFGGGNVYQDVFLPKGTYTIALQWDDDFYSVVKGEGAMNDLDIYLVDQFGTRLFGFNRNNINGDPFEILPFVVKADVNAKIIITRKSGTAPVRFKYVFFRGEGVIKNNSGMVNTRVPVRYWARLMRQVPFQ